MADTYTTNLNLTKPEPGAAEDTWGISLNADLDSLDAIFSSSGTQINLNPNQINFADNKKAIFGTGNDLQIYHDGSNSIIQDSGAGNLQLRGASFVIMQSDDGENMVRGQKNAGVRLYYDGATKLDTTSTGIDVTGTVTSDGLTVEAGIAQLQLIDTGVSGSTKLRTANAQTWLEIDPDNVQASSGFATYIDGKRFFNIEDTGDISFYDDTGTSQNLKWDASADTLNFVDNAKATFGAGSDLQIYHSGSNSIIRDVGTGDLRIQGANLQLLSSNGKKYLFGVEDAYTKLYYNNAEKLATTSTGIDVTGTVTSDGLTVDGVGVFDAGTFASTDILTLRNGTNTNGEYIGLNFNNDVRSRTCYIRANHDSTTSQSLSFGTDSSGTATQRLKIDGNGDISFYDDTGSTQGLFWDASAERLGIGTDSPEEKMQLLSSGNTLIRVTSGTSSIAGIDFGDTDDTDVGRIRYLNSSNALQFSTQATERMRIDSSGNLLVGTTDTTVFNNTTGSGVVLNSNGQLQVAGTSTPLYLNRQSTDGTIANFSKSGTTVGSIGIQSSGFYIDGESAHTGLRFTSAGITPRLNGAESDNTVNLGESGIRFKDLYLSGTANVGGVTSSGTITADTHFTSSDTNTTLSTSGSGGTVRLRPNGLSSTTGQVTVVSSGNVGIGTDSPSQMLELSANNGAGAINVLRFNDSDTAVAGGQTTGRIEFAENDGANTTVSAFLEVETVATAGGGIMTFGTGTADVTASEKMRLDHSGNLLVGKTSSSTGVAGARFSANGFSNITRDGGECFNLNRLTSDGTIIDFRKDSATVGSIGTSATDLFIGTGVAGLRFREAGSQLMPWNTTTNAANDSAIDIGKSDAKFKDLYLSGTANVGAINITGSGTSTFGGAITVQGNIITDSGRVGIGTSSPAYSLDTSTEDNIVARFKSTDASAAILLTDNTSTSKIDNNNGVLSFSADEGDVASGTAITFKTDTAERVRITSAGRMGIGTSYPKSLLNVTGTGADGGILTLENNSTSLITGRHVGQIDFHSNDGSTNGEGVKANITAIAENSIGSEIGLTFGTSGTGSATAVEAMRIDSSGKVGIGTSSPISKFHLVDGNNFAQIGDLQGNSTMSLRLADTGSQPVEVQAYGSELRFNTATSSGATPSVKMNILANGNVGIGTSSPSTKLHLSGADNEAVVRLENSSTGLAEGDVIGSLEFYKSDASGAGVGVSGSLKAVSGNDTGAETDLIFGTSSTARGNNAEIMRLTGDGNIGIGTNSPAESLHTTGNIRFGDSAPAELYTNSSELRLGVDRNNDNGTSNITFYVNNSETARIDASGRVGIGTATPYGKLRLNETSGSCQLYMTSSNTTDSSIIFGSQDDLATGSISYFHSDDSLRFNGYNNAERARIDSSGRLIVGGTSAGQTGATTIYPNGNIASSSITATGDGVFNFFKTETFNPVLTANDSQSDTGQIIAVQIGGTTKGNIGINSATGNDMYIASGTTSSAGVGLRFIDYQVTNIQPCRGNGSTLDNVIDLGSVGARFDDIYATNGTIQTSDENEKQDIQALTDAEQRVATACKGLIRRFRWQDSVAEKDDNPESDETARYHFGVIAQDLQDAFTAEGLNASDYGMFISSTWTDDDGVEQTRLGVRYNELLAFIITTL